MKKNRGIALLEVMMAMSVLSVGLVVLFGAFTTSLRLMKVSQNLIHGTLALESRVWTLEQTGNLSLPQEDSSLNLHEARWKMIPDASDVTQDQIHQLMLSWTEKIIAS